MKKNIVGSLRMDERRQRQDPARNNAFFDDDFFFACFCVAIRARRTIPSVLGHIIIDAEMQQQKMKTKRNRAKTSDARKSNLLFYALSIAHSPLRISTSELMHFICALWTCTQCATKTHPFFVSSIFFLLLCFFLCPSKKCTPTPKWEYKMLNLHVERHRCIPKFLANEEY